MDKVDQPDMVREVRPEPDDEGVMIVEPLAALMMSVQL